MTSIMNLMRAAVIALLLTFGAVAVAPAVAQDATQVAGQVADEAEEVVEDDDDEFDWGLLGLIGLAGLGGLMRRPKPVVHEDIDRVGTRRDNDLPRA